MSLLIYKKQYNQKPVIRQEVDWSHPLSKGLRYAWIFNENGGKLIHDSTHTLDIQGDPNGTWINGDFNYTSNAGTNLTGLNLSNFNGLSFVIKANITNGQTTNPNPFCGFDNGTSSINWWCGTNETTGGGANQIRSDANNTLNVTSTFALTPGLFTQITGTTSYAGTSTDVYADNTYLGNLNGTTIQWQNFTRFTINGVPWDTVTYNHGQSVKHVYIYDRKLSSSEVYWLLNSPYAFLKTNSFSRIKSLFIAPTLASSGFWFAS